MDRNIEIADTIEDRRREIEVRMLGEPVSWFGLKLKLPPESDFVALAHTLGFVSMDEFANWYNGLEMASSAECGNSVLGERILVRFYELMTSIGSKLTAGEIKYFFSKPHRDLYGDRPIDVLGTEVGYRAVREILARMLVGK